MMLKISAIAILTVFLGVVLDFLGFKSRKLLSILATVAILSFLGGEIGGIIKGIVSMSEIYGIGEHSLAVLKIIGIGYVFGISADICTELSEPMLAKVLTLAGRIEMFVVVLPYFEKTVQMGAEMLQ